MSSLNLQLSCLAGVVSGLYLPDLPHISLWCALFFIQFFFHKLISENKLIRNWSIKKIFGIERQSMEGTSVMHYRLYFYKSQT